VHQVRFVVGPFFGNHICFCWGRALSRIQFSMFQPWGLTTSDVKLCSSSSTTHVCFLYWGFVRCKESDVCLLNSRVFFACRSR
jgi:hypothetical protein